MQAPCGTIVSVLLKCDEDDGKGCWQNPAHGHQLSLKSVSWSVKAGRRGELQVSFSKPDQVHRKKGIYFGEWGQKLKVTNLSGCFMRLTHHSAYIICSWATFDICFTGFAAIFSSPGHMSYEPGLDYSSRDGVNRCSGQCRGSTHSEGKCCQGEQTLPPLWRVRKSMLYELNLMKPFPLTPCFCCIQCWFISPQLSGFMGWFGHLLTERLVKSGFLIVWCCWLGWSTILLWISLRKLYFPLTPLGC